MSKDDFSLKTEDFQEIAKDIEMDILALEKLEVKYLREIGKIGKECIVKHLPKTAMNKRSRKGNSYPRIHMKDDVKTRLITNKTFGNKEMKISGGKTGTLWHLVNDGTYRSHGNHFMDKAMNEIDAVNESLIDDVLKPFE